MRSAELQLHQIVKPLEAPTWSLLAAPGLLSLENDVALVAFLVRFLCFVAIDLAVVLPICPRRSFKKALCDYLKLVIFDS